MSGIKINNLFDGLKSEDKKGFMAHVYAGDPSIDFSKKLLLGISEAGVDILEIGIPYADPLADGPVFQEACQRGLDAGIVPDDVFAMIKDMRNAGCDKTVVMTTYYNIIFRMGVSVFVAKLIEADVQGLIVPDLALEESDSLRNACDEAGINLIYLVAPTTGTERIRQILKVASGFIYVVSITGVTGADKGVNHSVERVVSDIRAESDIPLLLGFGISNSDDCSSSFKIEGIDGVIVGSKICRIYHDEFAGKSDNEKVAAVVEFVKDIRQACD